VLDKLLAIDALIFLASAAISLISMRSRRASAKFEFRAEAVFFAGLVLLALVGVAIAFAIN